MLPDAHNTKRNNKSLQSVEKTIQHARCTLTYTHATLLLEEGIERELVQKRLGHASIVVTSDIYSHVTRCLQRKAADWGPVNKKGPTNTRVGVEKVVPSTGLERPLSY